MDELLKHLQIDRVGLIVHFAVSDFIISMIFK
jgi:hypothetical protein